MQVFLDANVFFAAAGSPSGGSAFVLELAKQDKFKVVTTTHALLEAERNIENKLGKSCILRHYQNLLDVRPIVQPIDPAVLKRISQLEKLLPLKDAPILLGAILSNADFLLTLDRKDFIDNEKLKEIEFSFKIMTPGEFLKRYIRAF